MTKLLDSKELADIGIIFRVSEETTVFTEAVREELEIRIGEEISQNLTDQQILEYERLESSRQSDNTERIQHWIDKNCPDFRNVVMNKYKELRQEIAGYASRIQNDGEESKIVCPKCGSRIIYLFCSKCGFNLKRNKIIFLWNNF